MRKLYAILVTLLFVTSVFGVASITAGSGCPCEEQYYNISQTSVQVGDTFTLAIKQECFVPDVDPDFDAEPWKFNEMIQFDKTKDIKIENGWVIATFKALRPGTLTIKSICCNESTIVTITAKEYPMFSFMKLLGFGKKK